MCRLESPALGAVGQMIQMPTCGLRTLEKATPAGGFGADAVCAENVESEAGGTRRRLWCWIPKDETLEGSMRFRSQGARVVVYERHSYALKAW
jgi:hypothetical protein